MQSIGPKLQHFHQVSSKSDSQQPRHKPLKLDRQTSKQTDRQTDRQTDKVWRSHSLPDCENKTLTQYHYEDIQTQYHQAKKKRGLFPVSSHKKNRVGRSAKIFFLLFFFFDTLVQLPKEHFPFKNLVDFLQKLQSYFYNCL